MATAKKTVKKAPAKKTAKKVVAKRPVGRPSSYKPEMADLGYKFALLGGTNERIAQFLGIHVDTFYEYMKTVPEFSESVTRGKDMADADIAQSLYHRARGYSHVEDDIRTVALGGAAGSEIVITPTVKHYPPDTAAATLWLKNRQPEVWRDKVQSEISGPNGGPIETSIKVTFV